MYFVLATSDKNPELDESLNTLMEVIKRRHAKIDTVYWTFAFNHEEVLQKLKEGGVDAVILGHIPAKREQLDQAQAEQKIHKLAKELNIPVIATSSTIADTLKQAGQAPDYILSQEAEMEKRAAAILRMITEKA